MLKQKKDYIISVDAKVIEVLPNSTTKFKVQLPNKKIIIARVSGKIRINNIRILNDDIVKVELTIYNFNEGRIVYRYK